MYFKWHVVGIVGLISIVLLSCAAKSKSSHIISNVPGPQNMASIVGIVTDTNGEPAVGAMITLSNLNETIPRGTATDVNGNFRFHSIPPSTYTVTIEGAGYEKYTAKGIEIQSGFSAQMAVVLAASNEEFQIYDPPSPVNLRSTSIGVIIYNDDNGFPRVETK
jgi:hypothetical protein